MGRIICAGLGPGDPDLMSVRADRLVRFARHVAFFRKKGRPGQARKMVESLLAPGVKEYASTVWRIGLMGPNASLESVTLILGALKNVLGR